MYLLVFYGVVLVPAFYVSYKMKYLISDKYFLKVILTFLSVYIIGMILYFFEFVSLSSSFTLFIPVYQLLLYRTMHNWFVKKYKSVPKDMAYNYTDENWPDRFFALGYLALAIFPWFAIYFIIENSID